MDAKSGQFSRWWVAGRLLWTAALTVCVAGAGFCWWSTKIDEAALRFLARSISQYETTPGDKVLALMWFVRDNGSTRRNNGTFGLPGWRATALQVAAEGGDCADKSRLLVALLTVLGMRATPALCFDAAGDVPAHTIVEAEITPGTYMVIDPAFGLWFPKEGGAYHALTALRSDPAIVPRRVAELQRTWNDGAAPDAYYLRASANYHTASTFNWNRGPIARAAFAVLNSFWGDDVYCMYRPQWLEEPKLKSCLVCLILAGLLVFMPIGRHIMISRDTIRGRRSTAYTPTESGSVPAAAIV